MSSFCRISLVTKGRLSIYIISPDFVFISGFESPPVKVTPKSITFPPTVILLPLLANEVSIAAVNEGEDPPIFCKEDSKARTLDSELTVL